MEIEPEENASVLEQLHQLRKQIGALEQRLKEDETVICALSSWTQYAFGMLLRHLSGYRDLDRAGVSDQIQGVYIHMFHTLKQGYRGNEELRLSKDGFDRLYIHCQETASIWESHREHQRKDDDTGHALINAACDILGRLDPAVQKLLPLETDWEKQIRNNAQDLLHRLRRSGPDTETGELDSDKHP